MTVRADRKRSKGPQSATCVVSPTEGAHGPYGNPTPSGHDATRLLTADELAQRWQVRPKQVYALVNRGEVPCIRIGRYRRFRLEAIEAWEAQQERSA